MFGIVDLIVVAGIKDALDFLSKKPNHIAFILGEFCQKPIEHIVGKEHIKECIDFIQNNRIEIGPYYQMDMQKRPSISVVASYIEEQQFLGDEGDYQVPAITLPVKVYASFDSKGIDGCKLKVSSALKLENTLWIGLNITNGKVTRKLKGIYVKEGQDTELFLDSELPEGTKLSGWRAESATKGIGYHTNSSMDAVTIQINLRTNGDYSVHRLLATIVRYCLKKQRLWFDQYGLQVSTYSQTPPLLSDESESIFETTFTINGRFTDTWIADEFNLADDTANIKIEVVAHTNIKPTEREDVEFDE